MKFVVGTVRAKAGQRQSLMEAFMILAAASRRDAGCMYFEAAPSAEDSDLILLAECYESVEAHRAHQERAHFVEFQAQVPSLVAHIRLDMIVTESSENIDMRLD